MTRSEVRVLARPHMKEQYITPEGLEDLKKELKILKTDKTREIAELIRHTASFGDLKENFAYHDAKEKQAFLQGRIKELEYKIKNAKVVEKKSSDKVQIGSDVTIILDGEEQKFSIVASDRVDPLKGKISYESPIGKALLNKSAGDSSEMEIGGNKIKYKILKIE
jgi:transcription elongation factor GreA